MHTGHQTLNTVVWATVCRDGWLQGSPDPQYRGVGHSVPGWLASGVTRPSTPWCEPQCAGMVGFRGHQTLNTGVWAAVCRDGWFPFQSGVKRCRMSLLVGLGDSFLEADVFLVKERAVCTQYVLSCT